jgi:hypothetical protein
MAAGCPGVKTELTSFAPKVQVAALMARTRANEHCARYRSSGACRG